MLTDLFDRAMGVYPSEKRTYRTASLESYDIIVKRMSSELTKAFW